MTIDFPIKERLFIVRSYFPVSGIQHRKQFELIHKYLPFKVDMGEISYNAESDSELVNISYTPGIASFDYNTFKRLCDSVFEEYKQWCDNNHYPCYSHLYLPCTATKYWQTEDNVVGTREILPSWVKEYLFKDAHVILTHNYSKNIPKTKRVKMQQELLKSVTMGDTDITPTEGLNQILLKYLGWCSANKVKTDVDFILPSPKNTKLWTIQAA